VSYQSEPARRAKPSDSQPQFYGQLAAQGIASNSISGLVAIQPVFDKIGGSSASVPAQQASVNAVMALLSSWQITQKGQHVVP
jgi:hypothetical protein